MFCANLANLHDTKKMMCLESYLFLEQPATGHQSATSEEAHADFSFRIILREKHWIRWIVEWTRKRNTRYRVYAMEACAPIPASS